MEMSKYKIKILGNVFLLIFFFVALQVKAQENMGMYYLHSVPNSVRLNPSSTLTYNGYFGGVIIPVSGQILPPLNIGLSINSFCYSDIIYKPGGAFGDSLATVFHDVSKCVLLPMDLDQLLEWISIHILTCSILVSEQKIFFGIFLG